MIYYTRLCAPDVCVPTEGVDIAVAGGDPTGGFPGAGMVAGDVVVVVVVVDCSPWDSKIVRPNRVFINSLEPETEN